ncbi:serine/threonine-protein kinase BCK1/SLK1/SSP31-like isoform X22 [Xenia sp. Carnegie-2017]|uniref:serine/threonine-protein kinase BCK1/SLK1/SSP31-like isoform X22 n=1 Tax=Xenia sp. Carnegie-2017 TaxID=2897299 RepID=UPI001F040D17|nr:serine/threonine-protein kinase BCK1/SLK1/SSP31-like isoform X22 [Xenia sp. Carnegie-2017]
MDTKDSRISENGTEDSGILGIGTKDSEILEIGTKNLGISEIVTKDSGNLEIGTKDSEIWKEIRERQRLLCEALGYWEGVYGYAFLTSFYVVCLIALEYADRVYGYSFLSILLPLCCLGIGLVCLLYGVFIALWFADRVYGHSCLVYLLFGAYLIGVVYLLYGVFSALWFADRVYGYSCLVYLLFGAYLIGVVYLLYGVFSGLLYLLYVVSIGLLYLLYGVSIALGYADRVYGYSCSNNFQEPTLKESETDPSMKKDNKIKRLSEASYEKISLPFPMSDNDYDDIDKTPSTTVLDADDNLDLNTDSNDNDVEASKIREPSECQLNDNDSLEDSDAMPSSEEGKQRLEGSNNFQEPTLKESETDPSMKKDNEIKRLSEASYEKISLPFPMSANDYDDIDKTPSTAVIDDDNSEVIIGVSPSTSKPDADDNLDEHFWMSTSFLEEEGKQRLEVQELLRQPWKCFDKSIIHQKKFKKMEKYGRKHPEKVTLLSELRVIFMKEFLLGKGSDGTRVYLALGNNGYGKAVKRIHKDSGKDYANREKEILIELNAKRSNHVVNFCHLEENLDEEYLYMILDLCEESLESYVKSSSLQDLQKVVPTILMQILKGLADLHSGERPILHRDLRPSNVLRDVDGNFLIADFGISHMLSNETSTHRSIQRGAKNWISPESYDASDASINKVRYKKESDIMNAGMVAYYFATKGKHPFGIERHRLDNILKGNPVGLDEIKDATFKDLLSWMLQLEPEDRPLANEALKHPYLQTDKENFAFLCDVGNEPEIKTSSPHSLPSNIREQLNLSIVWMDRIDPEFFNHFNKVSDSTWLGCLRFLRNVRQHWRDKPRPQLSSCVKDGNYQEYFLQLFEELPYLVHRAIRLSDWKARPDLEKHFPSKTQK